MQLTGFRHKGVKQIYAGTTARGVPAALADKLRKLLFALETAEGLERWLQIHRRGAEDTEIGRES
jgi:plasmid maintenance system killer protein